MSKKKIQFVISPLQSAFVDSIIYKATEPSSSLKKGEAFGKIFIESHPEFKSFKKKNSNIELDGE
jgi:hypothetical protein